MPSVLWNTSTWDNAYGWEQAGEEWSQAWGSSEAQWFGSIYPRIHRFIPCHNVLEIAPGFGRWSRFLIDHALKRYVGVDLSEKCAESCRRRFGSAAKATFLSNDGKSLPQPDHQRFDFVFSFDSLVHADIAVIDSYVPQILDLLAERGVCFLHHSNVESLVRHEGFDPQSPLGERHNRDATCSGENVAHAVRSAGGRVLVQEHINWGHDKLIDCLTLFCPGSAFTDVQYTSIDNPQFMEEAANIRHRIDAYCI